MWASHLENPPWCAISFKLRTVSRSSCMWWGGREGGSSNFQLDWCSIWLNVTLQSSSNQCSSDWCKFWLRWLAIGLKPVQWLIPYLTPTSSHFLINFPTQLETLVIQLPAFLIIIRPISLRKTQFFHSPRSLHAVSSKEDYEISIKIFQIFLTTLYLVCTSMCTDPNPPT